MYAISKKKYLLIGLIFCQKFSHRRFVYSTVYENIKQFFFSCTSFWTYLSLLDNKKREIIKIMPTLQIGHLILEPNEPTNIFFVIVENAV